MSDAPADIVIAEIEKNRRERIRVQLRAFKGNRFVDIRAFFAGDDGWIATGKGLAIKPALLDEVIEGLRKAQARAREEGLI